MKKVDKARVMVVIDRGILEKTDKVASELGFSRSGLVEMLLKNMIKADSTPFASLIEDAMKDIFQVKRPKKL